jgi:ATP-dependent Zn protease
MTNNLKNLLILSSVLLLALILYLGYQQNLTGQKISLEEFLIKVKNKEVKTITLSGKTNITFQTKDGKIFKTSKDPDESLTQLLQRLWHSFNNYFLFRNQIKKLIIFVILF